MRFVIIDDHPFIVEGYSTVLKSKFPDFIIDNFLNPEDLVNYVDENNHQIDLAIIDYNLRAYLKHNIETGIDVAKYIKSKYPSCKIIMLTAHTEKIYILDIIKSVRPNGFATKGEVSPIDLLHITEQVIEGNKFYSTYVSSVYNESLDDKSLIDDYNRQILLLLAKGYKIKELDKILPISYSAIQKRIAKMKIVLKVNDDTSLIKIAVEKGYL